MVASEGAETQGRACDIMSLLLRGLESRPRLRWPVPTVALMAGCGRLHSEASLPSCQLQSGLLEEALGQWKKTRIRRLE